MLSTLAVCYLFLGGTGAGALLIAQVADLLFAKTLLGSCQVADIAGQSPLERCLSFATLAGTLAVLAGVACLLVDLGRVDRVLSLFVTPSLSIMAVGAYVLAALAVVGMVLAVAHFAYVPWLPASAIRVVKVVAVVLALAVMTYTGLLLMDMPGVAFWNSPLLVALFVLSALSCGFAVVMLSIALVERDAQTAWLLRLIAKLDVAVIVLEALTAAAFVLMALESSHPARASSAHELLCGDLALLWWAGFVTCGLVVPLVAEAAMMRRMRVVGGGFSAFGAGATFPSATALLCLTALVLAGGLSMRFGIAEAGQHRALELQDPVAIELSDEEVEQRT